MTNEEIANALAKDYLLGHDRATITYEEMLGACLDMANWKDQQFKEYLKERKALYEGKVSAAPAAIVAELNEILNKLFGKTE